MKQKIKNITADELIPSAPTLANTMLADAALSSEQETVHEKTIVFPNGSSIFLTSKKFNFRGNLSNGP